MMAIHGIEEELETKAYCINFCVRSVVWPCIIILRGHICHVMSWASWASCPHGFNDISSPHLKMYFVPMLFELILARKEFAAAVAFETSPLVDALDVNFERLPLLINFGTDGASVPDAAAAAAAGLGH